jgi:hypothetical protein
MKFLEDHWWIILAIIGLWWLANYNRQPLNTPFTGFEGGSMGNGVTGDY